MNDYVVIIYNGEQVSVPKEVADFLEQDRKRQQAQDKQDVQLEEITAEKARESLNAIKDACLAYDADEAERLCGEIGSKGDFV